MRAAKTLTAVGLAAVVLLAMSGSPASACKRLAERELTAEEAAQRRIDDQQDVWNRADLVFTATIVSATTVNEPTWGNQNRAVLRPVAALKGPIPPGDFELANTGTTDCGPMPGFSVLDSGATGIFLVYAKGPRPGQETVLHTLSASLLVDPVAQAALEASKAGAR